MLVNRFCLRTPVELVPAVRLGKNAMLTITGGNMAVRARGSTGCTTSCSPPPSALPDVRLESDLSRVVELSARVRGCGTCDEMLPRCRTDACDSQLLVSKTPPKMSQKCGSACCHTARGR